MSDDIDDAVLADHEDEDWDEDEIDDEIIRAKWIMDGATTLTEASVKVREFADRLLAWEAEGWQLTRPVEDDYGFMKQSTESSEPTESKPSQ